MIDRILKRLGLMRRSQVPSVCVSRTPGEGTTVDIRMANGIRVSGRLEGLIS